VLESAGDGTSGLTPLSTPITHPNDTHHHSLTSVCPWLPHSFSPPPGGHPPIRTITTQEVWVARQLEKLAVSEGDLADGRERRKNQMALLPQSERAAVPGVFEASRHEGGELGGRLMSDGSARRILVGDDCRSIVCGPAFTGPTLFDLAVFVLPRLPGLRCLHRRL
jgi:hypothetical protein